MRRSLKRRSLSLLVSLVLLNAGRSQTPPAAAPNFTKQPCAREVNGAEEVVGPATVASGEIVTSLTAFQPRTFALKPGVAVQSQPVTLAYDPAVASGDGSKSAGGFDSAGRAIPAEMLPLQLNFSGVRFNLAPPQGPNAVGSCPAPILT